MEKKTAAEQLAHEIYCAEKRGEHNLSTRLLQEYAAQETAGMYTEAEVKEIIDRVKLDAAYKCTGSVSISGAAYAIKNLMPNKIYLKPQP